MQKDRTRSATFLNLSNLIGYFPANCLSAISTNFLVI